MADRTSMRGGLVSTWPSSANASLGRPPPGRHPDRIFAAAAAARLDRVSLSEQDRARSQGRQSLLQHLAVHRMGEADHFAAAIGLRRDQAITLELFERGEYEAGLEIE